LEEFKDHINVNTLGPLVLFRSTYKLLEKSSLPLGKFIVVASIAGSIADLSPMATAPYGLSKAGVNYIIRKLQLEHQNIIVAGIWYVSTLLSPTHPRPSSRLSAPQ
jgi:norsolorinic acid ketoreductase